MNKKIVDAINTERSGVPVLLSDLRKKVSISKKVFDEAVLQLAKSGQYFLTRHFHPGQLSEQEISEMVPSSDGSIFYAINKRDMDLPSVNEQQVTSALPKQPGKQPIAPKVKAIGSQKEVIQKSRRGRPPMPDRLRKKQIRPGFRLSGWVADWLKEKGDTGNTIEVALIAHYRLKMPD